jgi:hypothetical protein
VSSIGILINLEERNQGKPRRIFNPFIEHIRQAILLNMPDDRKKGDRKQLVRVRAIL